MDNPIIKCRRCGADMKYRPAGIKGPHSQNPGQPYKAFYSCTNRECGSTFRPLERPENIPAGKPYKTPHQEIMNALRELFTKISKVETGVENLHDITVKVSLAIERLDDENLDPDKMFP